MDYIYEGIRDAFNIFLSLDAEFLGIVYVSLKMAFTSTLCAVIVAVPLGVWIGIGKFRGREFLTVILNSFMSFPTVLVGLLLYSFLSRRGPAGQLGLLFTPSAVIIGQFVLALPIITAYVAGGTRNLGNRPFMSARILGAGNILSGLLFLKEARFIVITSILAGFGRVFSEVGASMMLGGNIRFYTRTITTAIALETSKGQFGLGIALGIVLMVIAFIVNATAYQFQAGRYETK